MGGSNDLSLKVILSAENLTGGALSGFGSSLGSLRNIAGMAAGALATVSVAAIGIGAASVQSAADFQSSMLKNAALAGLTQDQYTQMSQAILNLAPQVGQAPKDLADGLYYVLSAGIPASQAMDALSYSAKLAATGMTSTQITANALTNVMKVFGVSSKQAADIITKAVSDGKMTMEQYANSIGKLSLTAKGYNVSIYETNAALDTLTNNGFPSAAQASTGLANFLSIIDGRTDTVAKRAKTLGISFDEQAFKSMNLAQQVQYLNEKFKGHTDQIQFLLGGSKQAAQAFQALSGDTQGYNKILGDLQNASKGAGAANNAFAITQQGFNQKLAEAKAAGQALLINIGSALLPVLTQLAQYLIPIITSISTWIVKNGVLQNAVNGVVNVVKTLVGWGAAIVGFFQKNQWAVDLLIGALAGLVVGGLAFIATLIPPLIASFIAWSAAAWSAAIATLIAAAPFIAIGLAIMAVVVIILLLVQHWNQVVAFLKGVWDATVKGVMAGLQALGQFFTNIWNGIVNGLRAAWNWIVGVVQAGVTAVWNQFTAPFRAIAALFTWLYQHNTYFQRLVDTIRHIVQVGLEWVKQHFFAVITWLVNLWNGLKTKAEQAWNNVKQAVINAVLALGNWEIQQWNKAIGWLSDKWNSLKDLMGKAWSAVSGVVSSIWNTYIAGPLGNLWNNIKGWFDNLATQALQWGKNLIQGFINGIMNMASNVGNAVKNIASTVGNFLGFHSPAKQGPGATADQWAPNLVKMFSTGLTKGQPQIQAALNAMVSPMLAMNHGSPAGLPLASGYGRPPMSSSYNSYAGGGNHYGNNSFVIQAGPGMSPKDLADAVEDRLNRKYRRSGVMGHSAYGTRNS